MKTSAWRVLAFASLTSAAILPLVFRSRAAAVCTDDEAYSPRLRDFDRETISGVPGTILDRSEPHERRMSFLRELVHRDARLLPSVLPALLDDPDRDVRRSSAEYLAMIGDKRGLDIQAECLRGGPCAESPHNAARLLGAHGNQTYAPVLRQAVEATLRKIEKDGVWQPFAADRALLVRATIALARVGGPEDRELVLDVARKARVPDDDVFEALGYVDDPRAKKLLWDGYSAVLRPATCDKRGLGVGALLSLSRLGDAAAIEKMRAILKGVGTPVCPGTKNEPPSIGIDRGEAFSRLKPRDAANFAEAVFEVAQAEPEGRATLEAWTALGVMRPRGFGERLFKLAMTKKPHWKTVSRQVLHDTIMVIDPGLNERFWREYKVREIPTHSGQKALVEMGLSRLIFPGALYWTGD